jgi:hypothetical protein
VEHIRQQAKESFNRTVSGVDLIVGAPSGQLNLLLYSVFRMGSPTNNINFKSFQFLNKINRLGGISLSHQVIHIMILEGLAPPKTTLLTLNMAKKCCYLSRDTLFLVFFKL